MIKSLTNIYDYANLEVRKVKRMELKKRKIKTNFFHWKQHYVNMSISLSLYRPSCKNTNIETNESVKNLS